jgi:hypothetical protein
MDTEQTPTHPSQPTATPEEIEAKTRAEQKENFYQAIRNECDQIRKITKEINDGSQGLVAMAIMLLTVRGAANQILNLLSRVLMMLQGPPMPQEPTLPPQA